MLVELSIVPIGIGSSIGDQRAEVLKIIDASGFPYKVNPMGTVVEGEWDDIMKLIKRRHRAVMKTGERVLTTIIIDDRKGKPVRFRRLVLPGEELLISVGAMPPESEAKLDFYMTCHGHIVVHGVMKAIEEMSGG